MAIMAERYKDRDWLRDQYVNQGKSTTQIGDEVGANQGTIWYYLDKYDIERRDRIEAVKDAVRVNRAYYHIDSQGYAKWKANVGNAEEKTVPVHRLLAVSEYGLDAVCGKEVHHKNGIPWDNRPANIEPLTNSKHQKAHGDNRDAWKNRDNPYRDKEKLVELYDNQKLSCDEIANRMGVSGSTIARWVRKHGMEVRPGHIQRDEY